MKPIIKNCAIYTRKSTEEGLDQDFNSLDAQRESCEAYIISQKADGWKTIHKEYSDGGFSGGNLDRPAMQNLLADIKDGKVQTVVVYKIDRLTRSLMDFAKLVEVFDEYGVTFVSVTQSFNTTTSMGRLTLNVLLSFAQFEREVTGERIRDKIVASKKKGMWMGGYPPLGYERIEKKLVVQPNESKTIVFIFEEYLKLGTVKAVKEKLAEHRHKTPRRESRFGHAYGGRDFSRGHIHKILTNPVYAGKITHKDKVYEGLHEAIIHETLFQKVQQRLCDNAAVSVVPEKVIKSGALLQGLLFDADDTIYSPTYTLKSSKRYCYYVSQNLLQYKDHPKGILARLPAHEIEDLVLGGVKDWVSKHKNIKEYFPDCSLNVLQHIQRAPLELSNNSIKNILHKIIVDQDKITIQFDLGILYCSVNQEFEINIGEPQTQYYELQVPFKKRIAANGAIIINPENNQTRDPLDLPPEELKRIVRGIIWRDEHFAGRTLKDIAVKGRHGEHYVNICIQDSFKFLSQ